MASPQSVSLARDLLGRAEREDPRTSEGRVQRSLLVAAAFRAILGRHAIVVGGTAEDYWTADEYTLTDLDLVTWPLSAAERVLLLELGFAQDGRYWVHGSTGLPVEITGVGPRRRAGTGGDHRPGSRRSGDHRSGGLYLDWIRQATASGGSQIDVSFKGAVAIAGTNYDSMDWDYVVEALGRESRELGGLMQRLDRRVRRIVREAFA